MPTFDAHNHLHDPRLGDPAPVIAAMRAAGVTGCVTNATCEADWPAVAALAGRHPGFITPAFGIHPWRAHTATPGWQDRLRAILRDHPHATVGECGLDRWITEPTIAIQTPVFLDQLRIARELRRPVTIHCLKAWQPLFDAFESEPPLAGFLLHSFNGSIETARRLIPRGAFFSASGHILHPRKAKLLHTFLQLPPDRVLFETDAPDMLPPADSITHPLPENHNHPANLPAIAAALATHGLHPAPIDSWLQP
ncbi:MAG: TatD family hydrolase [Verrucomicrobiales bacterium]|nr:TatD family hydrolase [Verrucomicrobiota bacterium JB025]